MLVDEYIHIIKDEFPYLFSKYAFKIVHSEQERRYRYNAGIESEIYKVRMLFSRQQGAGVFYLGPLSAPFANEYSYQWITMANLLMYLSHKRINWDVVSKYKDEDSIRPVMQLLSEKFEVFCPKVLDMFSSAEVIAVWKPSYEQYIDNVYKESHKA